VICAAGAELLDSLSFHWRNSALIVSLYIEMNMFVTVVMVGGGGE
jgi:hypothetical protein